MYKTTFLKTLASRYLAFLGISCFSILGYAQSVDPSEANPIDLSQFDCVLYEGEYTGRTSIPRAPEVAAKMQRGGGACSTVVVNYGPGFTPQAIAAFEYAKGIWENSLESPVQITVSVSFSPLGPGVLGGASANGSFTSFDPDAVPDTFYPRALLEKIEGAEIGGGIAGPSVDINAAFSSSANWYYGLDANPPGGQVDFVSVVLHELGHGLGFFGGGDVAGGGQGSIRFNGIPTIYDRFIQDGPFAFSSPILDTNLYPDPSVALGSQLTGNSLFCNSPIAVGQLNGNFPKIFAPASFQQGSSYSHWDEATFVPGDINSLMTPSIGPGEANHNPGPITLGFFEDMGWSICGGSLTVAEFGLESVSVGPNPFSSTLTIKLANEFNDSYGIDIFDINGRLVFATTAEAIAGTIDITSLDQLGSAIYFMRITNTLSGASITKKVIKQ